MKKTTTYRDLVDDLIEMPRIRDALDLDLIPAPSTLCEAFDRLEMAIWRALLNVSLADLSVNGVTGTDASGFERLTGDKGYDDQKLRRIARDHDIRLLIKYLEFTSLHKAWNARLDSDLYHRRNMNETVNAAIKQKFGAFVRSRLWWRQFRELVIKSVVHNLERSLTISRGEGDCP